MIIHDRERPLGPIAHDQPCALRPAPPIRVCKVVQQWLRSLVNNALYSRGLKGATHDRNTNHPR